MPLLVKRISVLVLLLLSITGCENEVEIPEITLALGAYVVEDGEVVYQQLEMSRVYELAWEPKIFPKLREEGKIDQDTNTTYGDALTIETNGYAYVVTDEGLKFGYGDALIIEHLYFSPPTCVGATYEAKHGGVIVFRFFARESEEPFQKFYPHLGTTRAFTISAYELNNTDMSGDPRVWMEVELTYVGRTPERDPGNLRNGYTIEILSINRTPPAYW